MIKPCKFCGLVCEIPKEDKYCSRLCYECWIRMPEQRTTIANKTKASWKKRLLVKPPKYKYEPITRKMRRIRYGLSNDLFHQLLKECGNSCPICLNPFKGREPYVDHDHRCCPGKKSCGNCVRGLLCNGCNIRLGWLDKHRDNAITYLDRMWE